MNEMQRRSSFAKRAANEVGEFSISVLPTWIFFEIFLKLPLVTVINCKIVCRDWYKILCEPDFNHHYSKNAFFSKFLLPIYVRGRVRNRVCDRIRLCLIEISRSGEFIHTAFKPKSSDFSQVASSASSIIGSCNGLLCTCLVNSSLVQIYISNPITGDCISLPTCLVKPGSSILKMKSFNMFGFIPETNIFKVVRIPMWSVGFEETLKGNIFTVGVDKEWRNLPHPLTLTSRWSGGSGTVLNGTAHWILAENQGLVREIWSTSILTFDIEKEIFGRISHPPKMVLNLRTLIFVLNDKLCLIDNEVLSETTVWTMHQYGVKDSWSKVVVSHVLLSSSVFSSSPVAVALLPNGHILFSHGVDEYAIINNPKLLTLLKSGDPALRRCFSSHMLTYTPMFIPMENAIAGEIIKP